MKHYFYFLLLSAASVFCSCQRHDPAEEIVGVYSFVENGTINLAGQSQAYEESGNFTVSLKARQQIVFTGDFTGEAIVNANGTELYIDDDLSDVTKEGIRYLIECSYSNGRFDGKKLTWRTNGIITLSANGKTQSGVLNGRMEAKKLNKYQ